MTTTITDLDDFKALDPFFRIIEKGLEGIADGGHFFDLLAEDVIFDYIITTPGYPRRVEGRKAVAELYRPYGTMIVLDRCHDLAVHHDIKTGVVVLEYASEGQSFRPGPRTPTGTSRYSRSPIVRSPTGATTSTPWRSSTRSDGRHVDGRRERSGDFEFHLWGNDAAGIGARMPILTSPALSNAMRADTSQRRPPSSALRSARTISAGSPFVRSTVSSTPHEKITRHSNNLMGLGRVSAKFKSGTLGARTEGDVRGGSA